MLNCLHYSVRISVQLNITTLSFLIAAVQVGLPADREQYIHRLGRTGRKGKEGEGILLLAPWEEFFLSTVKELPITMGTVPSVDPDTKKKVNLDRPSPPCRPSNFLLNGFSLHCIPRSPQQ